MMKSISLVFCGLFISTTLFGQAPWDKPFKNLKVLADTISTDEMRRTMRAFSISLGVRCHFCHDDSNGQELNEINFEADVKPQKEIAREMIRMSRVINNNHITKIREYSSSAQNVACMTCHRGYHKPQHLFQVLSESYIKGGLNAAIEKYNELREKFYGGFTFDFGENSLNTFGYQLLTGKNYSDAIEIFKLNIELFPKSANVYDSLAEAYMANGNSELAVKYYSKSLSLNPHNQNASKMLEQLRTKQK